VLRGGFWNATSGLATPISTFVVSAVAARVLLPEGMGRQSFIAFSIATMTTLLTAGVPYALMRYVADLTGAGRGDQVRRLVTQTWRFESVAAVVGCIVLLAIAASGAEPRAAWVFGSVTCFFGVLNVVPGFFLKGVQRWKNVSLVSLFTGVGGATATVIVLLLGGGITGIFAVGAVATIAYFFGATRAARRVLTELPPASNRLENGHVVVRYALFQSIGVILTLVVWQRSEFFFLNHYSSDSEIAFYSVPFAAITAVAIVPQAMASSVLPAFASLVGADETERLRTGFGRAVRLLLVASFAGTALVFGLGSVAVTTIYGDAFSDAVPVLLILASLLPLVPLVTTASGLFFGYGEVKLPLVVLGVASVVNIGLDFMLIPDHGAIGAAIANVGAQMTAGVPLVIGAVARVGGISWEGRTLTRAALAAGVSGVCAFLPTLVLPGPVALVVGLVTGVTALLATGALLGILPVGDAEWLAGAMTERRLVAWLCGAWSQGRAK
jgi:O-antigen/teichoic acid export membrane protein